MTSPPFHHPLREECEQSPLEAMMLPPLAVAVGLLEYLHRAVLPNRSVEVSLLEAQLQQEGPPERWGIVRAIQVLAIPFEREDRVLEVPHDDAACLIRWQPLNLCQFV